MSSAILPNKRTRLLLLFLEHDFQLFVGQKTEVDEDLSDATRSHVSIL